MRVSTGFKVAEVARTAEGIVVADERGEVLPAVDEIIVTTGFRPDLAPLRELRLDLDPALESPAMLAPLVDPNVHSCGTAPPHGAEELAHPEKDIYIVGMKSYGRAPTFLLLTGYEQVRSVVAALAGDWVAARDVRLVLPETGVCSSGIAAAEGAGGAACCGVVEAPSAAALAHNAQGARALPGQGNASVASRRDVLAEPARMTMGGGAAVGLAGPARSPLSSRAALSDRLGSLLAPREGLTLMSMAPETEVHDAASCCAPAEQETCCDPSDKAACCGASPAGSCGCR